jgi:hypothetical protein
MRVLVLIDAWNFIAATRNVLTPAQRETLYFAALGNTIGIRLQAMHERPVADIDLRLYFSRTSENDVDRFEDNVVDVAHGAALVRDARRLMNEATNDNQIGGVRLSIAHTPGHAGHWRPGRARRPKTGTEAAGPILTDLEVVNLREKGADTMLSFDAGRAVALKTCDVLLLGSNDRDQLPILEAIPGLARSLGHRLELYNLYPVHNPGAPCAKALRARRAPEFGIAVEELKAIACPQRHRAAFRRRLVRYPYAPYGRLWAPPAEPPDAAMPSDDAAG